MEAYDRRYDVATYSTVERPKSLWYAILFGISVKTDVFSLRLLWRTPFFPKRRDTVSSTRPPFVLLVTNFSFRLSPYVIQVTLGAVLVIGTVPALACFLSKCVCAN